MNKSFTVLICSLLAINIANANERLPIHKNQLLSKARLSLIKTGWRPYITLSLATKPDEVSLMARQYIEVGYDEVGNCGASEPYCEFNYKKNGECLKVIAGSYESDIKINTVVSWINECER